MEIKKLMKERKNIARNTWNELKHYAQVLAVALTIGASKEIGLPNFHFEDGEFSLELNGQRLLGSVILIIGILALSEWLRRKDR